MAHFYRELSARQLESLLDFLPKLRALPHTEQDWMPLERFIEVASQRSFSFGGSMAHYRFYPEAEQGELYVEFYAGGIGFSVSVSTTEIGDVSWADLHTISRRRGVTAYAPDVIYDDWREGDPEHPLFFSQEGIPFFKEDGSCISLAELVETYAQPVGKCLSDVREVRARNAAIAKSIDIQKREGALDLDAYAFSIDRAAIRKQPL